MGQEIILKDVRLAFADLYKPGRPPKDRPTEPGKYGANLIMLKDSDAFKIAYEAFMKVSQETYGEHWANVVGAMEGNRKCIRDGNKALKQTTGQIRDGFAGMMYVAAKSKDRPSVVAHRQHNGLFVHIDENGVASVNGKTVQPGELSFQPVKPYSGCFVNAKIEIYAMKARGDISPMVGASLISVQFKRDGTAFGRGPTTPDGFEDEGDEDEGQGPVSGAAALF